MTRRIVQTVLLVAVALVLIGAGWLVYALRAPNAAAGLPIEAADVPALFDFEAVATGLVRPTHVTHAGDGSDRLFVTEQGGTVRIVDDGELLETPFLDISERVAQYNWEQGLLSIAFHPDYETNDRFFVYYAAVEDGRSVLAEYRVSDDPDRADPDSGVALLEVVNGGGRDHGQHYGGQLAFGPDGYLYVSIGDGYLRPEIQPGAVKLSQDLSRLPGSVLRLDVSEPGRYTVPTDNPFVGRDGARGEIWAYGLRNPWRFSFDRETGAMYLGDVGYGSYEEIDRIEPGGNYGWPILEGPDCYVQTLRGRAGCYLAQLRSGIDDPIAWYSRYQNDKEIAERSSGAAGGNSVTAGYVYRGERHPELEGLLFAADFIFGNVWAMEPQRQGTRVAGIRTTQMLVSSFGEDEAGELYLLDWASGTLFEVVGAGEQSASTAP